jgi:hypothetical protein
MNRHTPVVVLGLCQLFVVIGGLAFHLRIRTDLLARNLPPPAREWLGLATWLIPSTVALGTVLSLGALLAKRGRSRLKLVATGLVVSSLPAILVTLALFSAIFAG